jgi:cytochrome c
MALAPLAFDRCRQQVRNARRDTSLIGISDAGGVPVQDMSMTRALPPLALAAALSLAAPALAQDLPPGTTGPSPAQQGANLAEMWCNACHVTGAGRTEDAMDSAPPFDKLAPMVAADMDRYRTFLTRPHGPMKEITLSRDEIEAVLAYIASLGHAGHH